MLWLLKRSPITVYKFWYLLTVIKGTTDNQVYQYKSYFFHFFISGLEVSESISAKTFGKLTRFLTIEQLKLIVRIVINLYIKHGDQVFQKNYHSASS